MLDTNDQLEELTLVWLNDNFDYGHNHYVHITRLRNIISHVELFSNLEEFFNYLNSTNIEEVIVLISGSFCTQIVRITDEIYDTSNIYLLCTKEKIDHYQAFACKSRIQISLRKASNDVESI